MTFESPQRHTNTLGRRNFFTIGGSEYRALDVNWRDLIHVSRENFHEFKTNFPEEVKEAIKFEEKLTKKKSKKMKKLTKEQKKKAMSNAGKKLEPGIKEWLVDNRTEYLKIKYQDFENYKKYLVWIVPEMKDTTTFTLQEGENGNLLYDRQIVVDIPTIFNDFQNYF